MSETLNQLKKRTLIDISDPELDISLVFARIETERILECINGKCHCAPGDSQHEHYMLWGQHPDLSKQDVHTLWFNQSFPNIARTIDSGRNKTGFAGSLAELLNTFRQVDV